jgi:hypothetical protein
MTFFGDMQILDRQEDHYASVDEFHALRVNQTVRLIGASFVGTTKDTNFWAETSANGGTVTQNGLVVLETNASANATVQYQTVRTARFVPGHENIFRGVIKVGDAGATNNIRNWGCFTATDGVFFQLNGTSLRVVSRNNSVDSSVNEASWNHNTAFVLDTNYHTYEINMTYIDFDFYIDSILIHKIELEGTASMPTRTLNLPVTLQNNNSGGGTSDVTLTAAIAFVCRQGPLNTESAYAHMSTNTTKTFKYNPGRIHKLIINTAGTGGNTATIYDGINGTGNIIGVVATAGVTGPVIDFDCPFFTGLSIVLSSGGAADLTIIYE